MAPFSYQWSSSVDGINWINLPYTNGSFSASWCQTNANGVIFRCTVTDANGIRGVGTQMLAFARDCEPGTRQMESRLYPNPAAEIFHTEITMLQAGEVSITLINMLTNERRVLKSQYLAEGTHTLPFYAQTYDNGMYVLQVISSAATSHHYLVISK